MTAMLNSTASMPKNISDSQSSLLTVQRGIGLLSASTFIISNIIGSGIFVTPAGVLKYTGSVGGALAIWFGGGVIFLLGALCYIELGTTFPQSGSDFTYLRVCFGELPAFVCLWVHVIVILPVSKVVGALTLANYLLEPFFPRCELPSDGVRLIAALVLVLLTYINCHNVKWAARVADIFAFTKVAALVIIIITGIYHLACGYSQNFDYAFENTSEEPGNIALAFYSAYYAYSGWSFLNFIIEEVENPMKNLPRAIYISAFLVIMIYMFTNIAYLAVLTSEEILTSKAVAVTFSSKTLGVVSWIMPITVAVSIFGALNGGIFSASRLYFVGAREGHLPSFLSMINIHYYTPVPSIIFTCLLCLVYLSTTDVFVLITYVVFVGTMSAMFSVAGLVWLRYRQPWLTRPIKIPLLVPLTFIAMCLFLITVPFYKRPWETSIGLFITLSGIPVYYSTVYWEKKPELYKKVVDKFQRFIQNVLLSFPEETTTSEPLKQNFGSVNQSMVDLSSDVKRTKSIFYVE